MKFILQGQWKWVIFFIVLSVAVVSIVSIQKTNTVNWVTTTVTRGDVEQIVSVSGFVEAKNTANLGFPAIGTVTDVFVDEGSLVKKGDLLATLGASKLVAQRNNALSNLKKSQAARDILIDGPADEIREVSKSSVSAASEALTKTIEIEKEKVENAWTSLLSSDLQAYSVNSEETGTPPVISGTYGCEETGTYNISIYTSGTQSGFSYNLTGLEIDKGNVTTKQPKSFGKCGLLALFTEDDSYSQSVWTIEIPNTKSNLYTTYKNAYELALKQQEQNVSTAQNVLALSKKKDDVTNAQPSTSALRQADAVIASARAQISQIDAQIKDLSIVTPFDGLITSIDIRPGETGGTKPVITLLSQDSFELKARIPEIDITKVISGQSVRVIFDAKIDTPLTGEVSFVSPLATEIDGVAYFESVIILDVTPQWIRSGLNADIDITTESTQNTLRIPKRYLITEEDSTYSVLTPAGKNTQKTPIKVVAKGNNGYVGISGLAEEDVIIAP